MTLNTPLSVSALSSSGQAQPTDPQSALSSGGQVQPTDPQQSQWLMLSVLRSFHIHDFSLFGPEVQLDELGYPVAQDEDEDEPEEDMGASGQREMRP